MMEVTTVMVLAVTTVILVVVMTVMVEWGNVNGHESIQI